MLNLPWPSRRQRPTEQHGNRGTLKGAGGNVLPGLDGPEAVSGTLASENIFV